MYIYIIESNAALCLLLYVDVCFCYLFYLFVCMCLPCCCFFFVSFFYNVLPFVCFCLLFQAQKGLRRRLPRCPGADGQGGPRIDVLKYKWCLFLFLFCFVFLFCCVCLFVVFVYCCFAFFAFQGGPRKAEIEH